MPIPLSSHRPFGFGAALLATILLIPLGLLAWFLADRPTSPLNVPTATSRVSRSFSVGPPWLYGAADAPYTVTLYADLECPFCKAYFPVLKSWIDNHPEVMLEWSHLPLPSHEPAATELAVLVECVGEAGGHAAFWDAVIWMYHHTRGGGQGLVPGARYSDATEAVKACTVGDRAKSVIRAQAQQAVADGIDATPTVKLHDSRTGKSLLLPGPVDGDALLSALDLISANDTELFDRQAMPADQVGEPR